MTLADGSTTSIATHWNGKQLNSPNDIVCAADGGSTSATRPTGPSREFRENASIRQQYLAL